MTAPSDQPSDQGPSPRASMAVPMFTNSAGAWMVYEMSLGYGHAVVTKSGDAELGNWVMAERIRRLEDAALIAAAPDLYWALDRLLQLCETNFTGWPATLGEVEVRNHVRAALAKARGEHG